MFYKRLDENRMLQPEKMQPDIQSDSAPRFLEQIMKSTSLVIHNESVRKHAVVTIVGWTVLIALSLAWNIYVTIERTSELAIHEARALFNKDKAFRFWGSAHGGVYVLQTETTPPNPFLAHIPDRDITTEGGKKLTLMNPAYMVRQMMETYEEIYGVKGHITSTIHFRPETAPDEWEKKALLRFEKGDKEVVEFSEIDNVPYLRLMQPLYAQKSCLKCHGFQGYKEGDLRGGVSLSLPVNDYISTEKRSLLNLTASHLIFWLVGVFFIYRHARKLGEKTDALLAYNETLEASVAERTAELKESNEKLKEINQKVEEFNKVMVEREARIIEVKKEVNELCKATGNEVRYKSIENDD